MKSITWLLALCIFLFACNNSSTESAQRNDSTSMDSGSASGKMQANPSPDSSQYNSMQTVQTDAESSSFLAKAAGGGMSEVQTGELAQQKASNLSVKDFGAMMVRDHSAAGDKVKSLAAQRKITLPISLDKTEQKKLDDLTKKSGHDFDKAYMNAMVKDHETDIKEFENAEGKVKDNDVKSFITSTLPTLRMHLDSAKAIQKRLK